MTTLLYIKASPRGEHSKSAAIAEAYLTEVQTLRPALLIDRLDLVQVNLPEFDGNKAAAKMAIITQQAHDSAQQSAWHEIESLAQRFMEADYYVLAVPMWNGGIPYKLKHYIDLIHQPGLLFGLDRSTGYFGLLKNKQATLILTSGAYSPAIPAPTFGIDHHGTYLRAWLNQAGVVDIDEVRFQPTLLTSDPEGDFIKALAAAEAAAKHLFEKN